MLWRGFKRLSIRNKLLAMVLLPLAVVLPLLGVLLLVWSEIAFDRLLITKVRSDLAVAQGYFEHVLSQVGASAAAVADSAALHRALEQGDEGTLPALLARYRAREQLDFINLRGTDGRLRFTDHGAAIADDGLWPRLAAGGEAGRTSVEVIGSAQQALLGPELARRVAVPIVATRNASPSDLASEERAMVLISTRAIVSREGRTVGYVQGGVLLNRNLPFIDHINEIVYPAGSLPFGSQGTATLFLDDVRISTNVRLFGSEADNRAIGTRVSQTVREAVLARGSTWLDRAFVVNDWYVSAYQPLVDGAGRRVGMLYVGYLEQPFTLVKYSMLAGIGLIFFAVMIAAAVVSLRWARTIFAPIERMDLTMRRVEDGELESRVGVVDSADEIGRMALHLDRMLVKLHRWNADLDAKVAERTEELRNAQVQLVRSEKMATIGQLTASIAHEVNNPIAVIQGNLDLMRGLMPRETVRKVATELRLIDQQIERMRLIVTQLLVFAKPNEYAGYVESVAPARAVEDALVLVAHELAKTRIRVERRLLPTADVAINRNELQQVLVNLFVNAIQAMPGGGTLTLETRTEADGTVDIAVNDTGAGLTPELVEQLFRPFVTRKKDGTGLGLWISRGFVERYGGTIRAGNREDGERGARFSVLLRPDGVAGAPA